MISVKTQPRKRKCPICEQTKHVATFTDRSSFSRYGICIDCAKDERIQKKLLETEERFRKATEKIVPHKWYEKIAASIVRDEIKQKENVNSVKKLREQFLSL